MFIVWCTSHSGWGRCVWVHVSGYSSVGVVAVIHYVVDSVLTMYGVGML